jgi:hypothetical protein
VLKTIVFEGKDSSGRVIIGNALQAGYQVDILGQVPGTSGPVTVAAEAGLAAVPINNETVEEIQAIHKACVKFIGN